MTRGEKAVFLAFIVIGILLRFVDLDRKVYWYDEAFSSLEVSGFSPQEAASDILTGRPVTKVELEKYQFPSADSAKSVRDTVKGLIANEPQLTPAYFVLLRGWDELFPNSIVANRSLSALFSTLAIFCAAWLCRLLFPLTPRLACLCAALLAVSPFHVMYAQETRPYSMWVFLALLSTGLLLCALRRPSFRSWSLYCACAALSLYTFLFSVLILAGHTIFVAMEARFKFTRVAQAFAVSLFIAGASFLAWPYRGQHSGAGNDRIALAQYALKWLRSIGVVFADFDLRGDSPKWMLLPYSLLLIVLVGLCGYSVWFLLRRATRTQASMVLILILSICVPLGALDLLKHSSVSLVTRYLFPSLVGLQVAVAFLLTQKSASQHRTSSIAWRCCTLGVLVIGLVSSVVMVRANEWWNKDPGNYFQSASRIINSAPDPVVVLSDAWFVPVLSLEHKLRPEITYQLTEWPAEPNVRPGARSMFALKPSQQMREQLGSGFNFELVDKASDLWQLSRR